MVKGHLRPWDDPKHAWTPPRTMLLGTVNPSHGPGAKTLSLPSKLGSGIIISDSTVRKATWNHQVWFVLHSFSGCICTTWLYGLYHIISHISVYDFFWWNVAQLHPQKVEQRAVDRILWAGGKGFGAHLQSQSCLPWSGGCWVDRYDFYLVCKGNTLK